MPVQLLDLIAKAGQNAPVLANLGGDRVPQPVMCIGVEHSVNRSRGGRMRDRRDGLDSVRLFSHSNVVL